MMRGSGPVRCFGMWESSLPKPIHWRACLSPTACSFSLGHRESGRADVAASWTLCSVPSCWSVCPLLWQPRAVGVNVAFQCSLDSARMTPPVLLGGLCSALCRDVNGRRSERREHVCARDGFTLLPSGHSIVKHLCSNKSLLQINIGYLVFCDTNHIYIYIYIHIYTYILFLLFSRSVVSNSLWPHGLQHTRRLCPSPSPGACSNSCPFSQWCHPTISFPAVPFSSCPQSVPASGSFPMSQLFASGGQSIGASASASVLPMNIQDWSPLGWTGWISLQSRGLSRAFSNTKHQFFGSSAFFRAQPSHPHITTGKTTVFTTWTSVSKVTSLLLICCLGWSQLFFQGARVF